MDEETCRLIAEKYKKELFVSNEKYKTPFAADKDRLQSMQNIDAKISVMSEEYVNIDPALNSCATTDIGEINKSLTNDQHSVHLIDLYEVSLLGSGMFARVSLVRHRDESKTVYALKTLPKYDIMSHEQEFVLIREKALMLECDHPFITKLHATFKDKRYIYMLSEAPLVSLGREVRGLSIP